MARRHDDIVKAAIKQGWSVEHTNGGHRKFTPPQEDAPIIYSSISPSDKRARWRLISDLRKTGYFTWQGR